MKAVVALIALLCLAPPAMAVEPHEMLDDPALEARARELSAVLRCLVCQNQSIDESNASLAADLRVLVRERLVAGDSDSQVLDYMVARYGDFVLLRPPIKPKTYALYLGPFAFLILALFGGFLYFRRRAKASAKVEDPLSAEEQKSLNRILEGDS